MITYLLPLLIANTGGRMVYGIRGGVVGDDRDRWVSSSAARHRRCSSAR